MVRFLAATTPMLLAATIAAGAAGQQSPANTTGDTPAAPLTIVGCIVRNGSVDPNKGTRTLDIAPGALALTNARVVSSGRGGAGSGAVPQDSNTGTIPQRTIVGGRGDGPDTQTFALSGERVSNLGEFVGRRVEIVGRIADGPDGSQARGTTGTSRGAAPVPGVGTREERPAESSAHPSAELQTLNVVSFKGVSGGCE